VGFRLGDAASHGVFRHPERVHREVGRQAVDLSGYLWGKLLLAPLGFLRLLAPAPDVVGACQGVAARHDRVSVGDCRPGGGTVFGLPSDLVASHVQALAGEDVVQVRCWTDQLGLVRPIGWFVKASHAQLAFLGRGAGFRACG